MRKGATTEQQPGMKAMLIVALRNEKGSYNQRGRWRYTPQIVALRNEKGSYNSWYEL